MCISNCLRILIEHYCVKNSNVQQWFFDMIKFEIVQSHKVLENSLIRSIITHIGYT
jgi:hypothetical protein